MQKFSLTIGCLVAALIPVASNPQNTHNVASQCEVIQDALKAISDLNPGDSRAKVEKNFELDGGMQWMTHSRYVLRKCHSVKIDVEFSGAKLDQRAEFSTSDKVVKLSKPYLEYEVRD